MSRPAPLAGDLIAGKYQLLRIVGEGGMGTVYEALNIRIGKRVAVKMLAPWVIQHPEAVARFEREARAAAQLRSVHVVEVFDVETLPSGHLALVMEFLEGVDLAAEIERRGPLPVTEAVRYLLEACEALGVAHAAGLVHRDIKPANLFLAEVGGRRLVKVVDFGIAKVRSDAPGAGITRTMGAMGTPLYMAPEQALSPKSVDHRADIWSLGAVLYHCLAGTPPFDGETSEAIQIAIALGRIRPLRAIRDDVPEALATIVMRALCRDRDARIPDTASFARDLAPFAEEARTAPDPALLATVPLPADGPPPRAAAQPDAPTLVLPTGTAPPSPGPVAATAPGLSATLPRGRSLWTARRPLMVLALTLPVAAIGLGLLARSRANEGSAPEPRATTAADSPTTEPSPAPEATQDGAPAPPPTAPATPSASAASTPPPTRTAPAPSAATVLQPDGSGRCTADGYARGYRCPHDWTLTPKQCLAAARARGCRGARYKHDVICCE